MGCFKMNPLYTIWEVGHVSQCRFFDFLLFVTPLTADRGVSIQTPSCKDLNFRGVKFLLSRCY